MEGEKETDSELAAILVLLLARAAVQVKSTQEKGVYPSTTTDFTRPTRGPEDSGRTEFLQEDPACALWDEQGSNVIGLCRPPRCARGAHKKQVERTKIRLS